MFCKPPLPFGSFVTHFLAPNLPIHMLYRRSKSGGVQAASNGKGTQRGTLAKLWRKAIIHQTLRISPELTVQTRVFSPQSSLALNFPPELTGREKFSPELTNTWKFSPELTARSCQMEIFARVDSRVEISPELASVNAGDRTKTTIFFARVGLLEGRIMPLFDRVFIGYP